MCAVGLPMSASRWAQMSSRAFSRRRKSCRNASAERCRLVRNIAVLLGRAGAWRLAYSRIAPEYRARNVSSEAFIGAADRCRRLVAILTTSASSLSLVFETVAFLPDLSGAGLLLHLDLEPAIPRRFRSRHPAAPVGHALCVVCRAGLRGSVGLMVAIYLAEYAARPVRAASPSRPSRSSPASRPSSTASSR